MSRLAASGHPANFVLLTISASREVVAAGDEIAVMIALKNTHQRETIQVSEDRAFFNLEFDLTSLDQQPVPYNAYGAKLLEYIGVSTSYHSPLKPGAVRIVTIRLDRYFDMSIPDTYHLTVCHPIEYEGGHTTIESNLLSITVTEGESTEHVVTL